jgi:hypothetical protein
MAARALQEPMLQLIPESHNGLLMSGPEKKNLGDITD